MDTNYFVEWVCFGEEESEGKCPLQMYVVGSAF